MTPVLLLLALAVSGESASILAFFPVPFPSHHFIFRPVIEGLAERGHSILYVTGYPYKETPKNINQIALSYNISKQKGKFFFFNSIVKPPFSMAR